jgi:protein-S-isoprenylcysteine O-methyltransferase Ste14
MSDPLFEFIYFAGLISGSIARARYIRLTREIRPLNERTARGEYPLLFLAFLGMLVFPLIYAFSSRLAFADYRLPVVLRLSGAGIFVLAHGLLWRSHADLGRNWSITPRIVEGHSLVTEGVYRRIRHPMYAAHGLWGIAQTMLLPNWFAGWTFPAAFLVLYRIRVPQEEAMMIEHFGEAYRSYMKRTGRLFPAFRRSGDRE